jgi:hypothetical protein
LFRRLALASSVALILLGSQAPVTATGIAGVVTTGASNPAFAADYLDTRSDPDPPSAPAGYETMRIDFTTRSVWTGGDGRRWLTVITAPFDRNFYVQVKVHLDTDGDQAAEFVLIYKSFDLSGEACWLRELHGGREIEGHLRRLDHGGYPEWGGPVACRVMLGFVQPTARIGWWAAVRHHGDPSLGVFDRAPNSGWYA